MPSPESRVRDVMTQRVITIEQNEKLTVAHELMLKESIRHLPVVDADGKLAGIVSQRDLFLGGLLKGLGYGSHARDQALASLLVKEAMHNEVLTTTPATRLEDAARTLIEKKIGCLVVIDQNTLVGILTESDFVKLVLR
mgnify:CR=1 FL=1